MDHYERLPPDLDRYDGLDQLPDLQRVVVGVDPSGTSGEDKANSVGIVCVGLGVDDVGYVLADWTCSLPPLSWARRVVECYHRFSGDRIVAERNFGGAMVESTIRTVDPDVPIRLVVASRGKIARAEPVAALYEQGRIKHAGAFPDLEDQLIAMTPEGYIGGGSPDRVDALVWAVTDLMLRKNLAPPPSTGTVYVGRPDDDEPDDPRRRILRK